MNATKTTKVWIIAVAVVVIAAGALAAAALQDAKAFAPVRPKPEKLCPITFHLDPVTSLQARFAADIEKTNAKLAEDLSLLRTEIMNKTLIIEDFVKHCQGVYAGTYLARPVLWGEGGVEYKGWLDIVKYLVSVIPHTTFIHPQAVNVYLEYLPPDMQTADYLVGKRSVNLRGFPPGEVDFLVMIRTVIAYAPYDDPMEWGNETAIPHRKVCDPIY